MQTYTAKHQLLLLLFAAFATISIEAQQTPDQLKLLKQKMLSDERIRSFEIDAERQTPALLKLNTGIKSVSKSAVKEALNSFYSTRPGIDNLVETKTTVQPNGASIIEYQQYYRGVKVDRAVVKAYVQNGVAKLITGNYYQVPAELNTAPFYNNTKAIDLAKGKIKAKKYADEVIKERMAGYKDAGKIARLQQELTEAAPAPELVVIKDFTKPGFPEMHLAYKVNVYAAEPISRSYVYIDAKDGKTLLVDAIIKHVDDAPPPTPTSVRTTVTTRYAGNRDIYVKQISGNDPQSGLLLTSSHPTNEVYIPGSPTYVLMDDTRGNGVETYDLNGIGGLPISVPPAYTVGKSFTDVNNQWTLSEHKRSPVEEGPAEAENDDIAWDAHWGAGVVYDYWKNNHNRLSFDGKDAKIKSFIHSGIAYDNAFWNGSVMTYGDGSGVAAGGFKPLTSLDVCGHEIGHGVCSNTSDLVYANESGAMNEGLSDIWAACIEYYAIKKVDPSLASRYKPFYIGEQISASPASPLRRMDNPIAKSDPDTYGGRFWTSQVGCSPTLANDQCGVHNNSGVLNKWFYLITVGSHAGSGPDAAFAGEDDGINDAVTTGPVELQHPANAYQVTGVGFAVSEQITYIMETMLTSTATFAEAREVSIAVAIEMSGSPCSALVETVTNAWYAVGVGGKFVKPCTVTYGFVTSNGAAVSESTPTADCAVTKEFSIPFIMPGNSTAKITLGGTALRDVDYIASTASISNTSANAEKKNIVISILNDGATEPDETVIVNIALTNTAGNPVNSTYTLTILDDDAVPVVGNGDRVLLSETFTRADGFADPDGWAEKLEIPESPDGDPTGSGKNQWGIFDNKLTITGKEGTTGTKLPNGTYNSNSNSQTVVRTPLIDGRGLSLLKIKFDYTIQGEIDPAGTDPENFPAFDYMAVAYSLDGINFIELADGEYKQFASALPTSGTLQANLPVSLANKQFYLGFRWFNDTNAGGPFSASIDNLVITGTPRTIEKQLYHNSRNVVNKASDTYFLSAQDGEVLGHLVNNGNYNLGCTNIAVEKEGAGTFNLYTSANSTVKASNTILRITPEDNGKTNVSISLYYTEDRLAALEAATGQNRTSFSLYQVDDLSYTLASSRNTTKLNTVYTAIPGVGGYFTITASFKIRGSYALGTAISQAITLNRLAPSSETLQVSKGYPNPATDVYTIQLVTNNNTQVTTRVTGVDGKNALLQTGKMSSGSNQVKLPVAQLAPGIYLVEVRGSNGEILFSQKMVKK